MMTTSGPSLYPNSIHRSRRHDGERRPVNFFAEHATTWKTAVVWVQSLEGSFLLISKVEEYASFTYRAEDTYGT